MSKLLELSEPLLPHPFFCRFSEPTCGNRLCTACVDGRGSRYVRLLSHDPFLLPFPSDPCGHVTLKRNALGCFKDHYPGLRARSAHSPTQRTQTIPGRRGPWGSLIQPLPAQWRYGAWSGSYQPRSGRSKCRKACLLQGEKLGTCCWASTALESDRPQVRFWLGGMGCRGAIQLGRLALYHSGGHPLHYCSLGFVYFSFFN